MLFELLLIGGAAVAGKKAIENPEKAKEFGSKAMESLLKAGDRSAERMMKSGDPEQMGKAMDYYEKRSKLDEKLAQKYDDEYDDSY